MPEQISKKRLALIWLGGFIISLVPVWLIGKYFCSEVGVWTYYPQLNTYLNQPGTRHYRSEGWGETHWNKNGLLGTTTMDKGIPDILIYGDSYIEAYHVHDSESVYGQLNRLQFGARKFRALAAARSGYSWDDWVLLNDFYSKLFKQKVKYIVIALMANDLIVPEKRLNKPDKIKMSPCSMPMAKYRKFFYKNSLQSFWITARKAHTSFTELDFSPKTTSPISSSSVQKTKHNPEDNSIEKHIKYWTLRLQHMKKNHNGKILILLTTGAPTISNGEINKTMPPPSKYQTALTKLCRKMGVDILNLTPEFYKFFDKTGIFPTGFSNTFPGRGHWNKYGHKLAAEAIARWINRQEQLCFSQN